MKTKIKAIIAATATAALSLGIATVVLAEQSQKADNPSASEKDNQVISGTIEKKLDNEAVQVNPENVYTAFEKKALSCFGTYEDAKNNKHEGGYVEIKLDSLTIEGCGFDVTGERFFLTVPEGFGALFNEPKSFEFTIGENGKMTAKPAYVNNPMCVKIVMTFDENGKKSTKMLSYNGIGSVDSPLVLSENQNPTGITYFCYMEDNNGNVVESAVVDLVEVE